jgi:queuine tRNA-ribosyltransferase
MKPLSFRIHTELANGLGRVGEIVTAHGTIKTPAFVPVATQATIKSLTPEQVEQTGAQVVLANTYHLYLQPGDQIVQAAGGLGSFMHWPGPTMTDSGGFQVFSLGAAFGKGISKVLHPDEPLLQAPVRSIDEDQPKHVHIDHDGVMFRSHRDGSSHYITPQKSIAIQHNLGADIIFAFDECVSPTESLHYQKESLERTHRWAKIGLEYHQSQPNAERQALFGIVQGGRYEALRKESAQVIGSMPFDGFGIGGSFAKEDMNSAVEWVNSELPKEKPRHLLGIGEPEDLVMGCERGVDTFDCVAPTRMARNGHVYVGSGRTGEGRLNLLNAQFVSDFAPIDSSCQCYTCKHFTRAYLAHLFRAKEMLAATLATIHNLTWLITFVDHMRSHMMQGTFDDFKKEWYSPRG